MVLPGDDRRSGDERRHPEPQGHDVSKLTFPVQMVIMVVSAVVSVVVSVLGATSGMRSDLRDIQTRAEIRAASYIEDRETMQASIRQLNARVELMTIEIQNLNLALARAGLDTQRK